MQARSVTCSVRSRWLQQPRLSARAARTRVQVFRHEGIGLRRLESAGSVPGSCTFGVEMEVSMPVSTDNIRQVMEQHDLDWQVKVDNSIRCGRTNPDCHKVELVTRAGGEAGMQGFNELFKMTKAIKPLQPTVNKSTGMHVHVRPRSGWTLPQLKTLCHNFVQLEGALDQLIPRSRRQNRNQYCKSNWRTLTGGGVTADHKRAALARIKNAASVGELVELMCPGDRYYKLNLRALERHGTVELRLFGGTQNGAKTAANVLLALYLAEESLQGRKARIPRRGQSFENLVSFFERYPLMQHWLPRRRAELAPAQQRAQQQAACSCGGTCADCS